MPHPVDVRRRTCGKHSLASLETTAVVHLAVLHCSVLDCAGSPWSAVIGRWRVRTDRGTCSRCDESSDRAALCRPATSHCQSSGLQSPALAAPVRARLTCNSWHNYTIKYQVHTSSCFHDHSHKVHTENLCSNIFVGHTHMPYITINQQTESKTKHTKNKSQT